MFPTQNSRLLLFLVFLFFLFFFLSGRTIFWQFFKQLNRKYSNLSESILNGDWPFGQSIIPKIDKKGNDSRTNWIFNNPWSQKKLLEYVTHKKKPVEAPERRRHKRMGTVFPLFSTSQIWATRPSCATLHYSGVRLVGIARARAWDRGKKNHIWVLLVLAIRVNSFIDSIWNQCYRIELFFQHPFSKLILSETVYMT